MGLDPIAKNDEDKAEFKKLCETFYRDFLQPSNLIKVIGKESAIDLLKNFGIGKEIFCQLLESQKVVENKKENWNFSEEFKNKIKHLLYY